MPINGILLLKLCARTLPRRIARDVFAREFSCTAQGENSLLGESVPGKTFCGISCPIFQTSRATNEWICQISSSLAVWFWGLASVRLGASSSRRISEGEEWSLLSSPSSTAEQPRARALLAGEDRSHHSFLLFRCLTTGF